MIGHEGGPKASLKCRLSVSQHGPLVLKLLYLCQMSILLLLSHFCVIFSRVGQSLLHLVKQIGRLFPHALATVVVLFHEVREDVFCDSSISGFTPSLILISACICLRFVFWRVDSFSKRSLILVLTHFQHARQQILSIGSQEAECLVVEVQTLLGCPQTSLYLQRPSPFSWK